MGPVSRHPVLQPEFWQPSIISSLLAISWTPDWISSATIHIHWAKTIWYRLELCSVYLYCVVCHSDMTRFFRSVDAGKGAFQRYSKLVSPANIPFVRASSSARVVDSATNWTSGNFFFKKKKLELRLTIPRILDCKSQRFQPSSVNNSRWIGILIFYLHAFPTWCVTNQLNDTLDDAMCPNAGSSDPQTNLWTSIYGAPIAARLNAQAPGAKVTTADISNLIPLCAFETLAKETPSPFCALFTDAEFAQFEYFGDLDKFYNTGSVYPSPSK